MSVVPDQKPTTGTSGTIAGSGRTLGIGDGVERNDAVGTGVGAWTGVGAALDDVAAITLAWGDGDGGVGPQATTTVMSAVAAMRRTVPSAFTGSSVGHARTGLKVDRCGPAG